MKHKSKILTTTLLTTLIVSNLCAAPSAYFSTYDKNQDGFISKEDNANTRVLNPILKVDANKDKKVSEEEFKNFEKNHLFYLQDVNNDGFLTGMDNVPRLHQALKGFDENSDRKINLDEYSKYMENYYFDRYNKNGDEFIDSTEFYLPNFKRALNGGADVDKDGKLNKIEFNEYISNRSFYNMNKNGDEFVDMEETGSGYWVSGGFVEADRNSDGQLDKNEMKDYNNSRHFVKFDSDGDSFITKDEFGEEEWNKFKNMDRNKDGKISRLECIFKLYLE